MGITSIDRIINLLILFTIMSWLPCNILTWNVRCIMSSAGSLSAMLDKYNTDIAFVSEHKLLPEHAEFMNSLHRNYTANTVCDASESPGKRCGKAGVSILYKKDYRFTIDALDKIPSDRICGVRISGSTACSVVYAFAVYLPPVNYNDALFCETLNILKSLFDSYVQSGSVIVCGDFN